MTGHRAAETRYDRPVAIADGVCWIGFYDEQTNLHCNPYLIVQGGDAVVIDCGSRPEFPTVMMKILMTGITPARIRALIYSHYDPDLCGSMPNMIDMCGEEDLVVLSHADNIPFIGSYVEKQYHGLIQSIDTMGYTYSLNGRVLHFYRTPYCHTSGSFITYDAKTATLFTGDLFGSFSHEWDLFLRLRQPCDQCSASRRLCESYCPLDNIARFHQQLMPSGKALRHALATIKRLDVSLVAPQHGSIIKGNSNINIALSKLESLKNVGADGSKEGRRRKNEKGAQ